MPRSRSRSRPRSRGPRRSRSRSAERRPDARDRTKARSRERSRRSPPRGSRNGDHGEARSRSDDRAERERRGPGPGGTSLLFRNIGERNTVDDLRDEASRYGGIKDVYIPMDFRTRRPKPFAFVEFFKPGDAAAAKSAMDNRELRGSVVSVVWAEKGRKSADIMRKQDGGGGGGGYRSRGHRSRSRSRERERRFVSRSPQRSDFLCPCLRVRFPARVPRLPRVVPTRGCRQRLSLQWSMCER